MNTLKAIIKTIITKEIQQDEGVFADGFILEPYSFNTVLKGDGKPTETVTMCQLDYFYKNKGEMVAKTKLLVNALANYPISDISINWESTARLYRATVQIEIL